VTHPWRRRWLGTPSYWFAQLVGWSGVLALVASDLEPSPQRSKELFLAVLFVGTALGGTHLLRVVLIYYRGRRLTWTGFLVRIGLWSIAMNLAIEAATLVMMATVVSVGGMEFDWGPPQKLAFGLNDSVLLYVIMIVPWVSLYYGINYYRTYQLGLLEKSRLEVAVKDAELRSLRAQVDPHFLFNSLNTLRALIPRELTTARAAVTLLSEVLRTNLTSSGRATVPLAEELEHADNYLALEKLRLEERLQIRCSVTPAARPCLVPTLAVQTLVENAVKFGVAARVAGGEIGLHAEVTGGFLRVVVSNPGRLAPPGSSTGLGLRNVRARLELIFGPHASLTLSQTEPNLVCAELRVPRRLESPAELAGDSAARGALGAITKGPA